MPHPGDASWEYTGAVPEGGASRASTDNTPRADTPQNCRFMPRSAPPGAPPASALYQVSAYGCAVTVSVAAATTSVPPTTASTSRAAVCSVTTSSTRTNRAAPRAAHAAPTPAALHRVGSAG